MSIKTTVISCFRLISFISITVMSPMLKADVNPNCPTNGEIYVNCLSECQYISENQDISGKWQKGCQGLYVKTGKIAWSRLESCIPTGPFECSECQGYSNEVPTSKNLRFYTVRKDGHFVASGGGACNSPGGISDHKDCATKTTQQICEEQLSKDRRCQ